MSKWKCRQKRSVREVEMIQGYLKKKRRKHNTTKRQETGERQAKNDLELTRD